MLIYDSGTYDVRAQLIAPIRTVTKDQPSFADRLSAVVHSPIDASIDEGTVTLDLHHMTGNQFMALEQTLHSEGKSTQTFLSPADNDWKPTDQIAMYGSWAKSAAQHNNGDAAAGYLAAQKILVSQGDSTGQVTVDAATYNIALAGVERD